jgi:hypothetical protein
MSTNSPVPQGESVQSSTADGIEEVTLRVPFPDSFVYSNIASFSISLMDIRIGFGEAMPDRTVQPRVGIVMPPEQAALVAMHLFSQLHVYERAFGPIRLAQWQSQKDETIKRLLESGMIHPNPEATGPLPDQPPSNA